MKKFLKWTALTLLIVIAGAIAWFWTPDRDPDELRALYANDSSQFIELDSGLTVHVRDQGPRDAPVIMLLHGSSASLQTWEPWVEQLSTDYRVITYDQPGHGLTGPTPDGNYDTPVFVETAQGVAEALEHVDAELGLELLGPQRAGLELQDPLADQPLLVVQTIGAGDRSLAGFDASMSGITVVMPRAGSNRANSGKVGRSTLRSLKAAPHCSHS